MFNIEKVNLSLNYGVLFFIICLILLTAYAFYVYKHTIPPVSPFRKYLLLALRTLALLLLLFVFFEPTLTIATKKILEPSIYVFTDNSRSITIKDGTNREGTIKSFLDDYKNSGLVSNSKLYLFGNKVIRLSPDSLNRVNFSEGSTNFEEIFSNIKKSHDNISSIVIISDGVLNEGIDPSYESEKLNIPIYTIGIGDTTHKKDIQIKNVLANEFIYAGTPTKISAVVLNTGYAGKTATINFMEDNKKITSQKITLDAGGVQNVDFTYKPETSGEKKLSFEISKLKNESTYENNRKVIYVKVLNNKLNVLLIAGAPSSDFMFIKNTLTNNSDYSVHSITQIGNGAYLEKVNKQELVDSANVIFLLDFPTKGTTPDFLRIVKEAILNKNKPFFIDVSGQTDISMLQQFQSELPFSVSNPSTDYFQVQPNIQPDQSENPLLQNNASNPIDAWDNLPPVYQLNADYKAKPESEVLAKDRINNVPVNSPLILTRRLGNRRSIAVLAQDIWKWKLGTAEKNINLFDQFINSSVKWLNNFKQQKQVTIKTNKKLYSLGENVDFSAQVYDEAYNPISDAEVNVNINGNGNKYHLTLNSIGKGIYEGNIQLNKPGDYSFNGNATRNTKTIGYGKGNFNIGEVDIEMLNPRMNYEFLKLMSKETGGKFFYNRNYQRIFQELKNLNKKSSKEKIITSEISLWSNEWLMILAILLFAFEWFLRKRYGML